MNIHDCEAGRAARQIAESHCQRFGYGEAIEAPLFFDPVEGEWVVGNGEYGSAIRYCPWCGLDLSGVPIYSPDPSVDAPLAVVIP